MEAPEKIYIDANENWLRTYTAFTKKAKGNDIEYTRTDAFIEKACEWLEDNANNYIIEHPFGSDVDFEEDKMIEDFKKYMRG